jgi:hypothetical protein
MNMRRNLRFLLRASATRMGLTDCIGQSALPTGLLIFPRIGFSECLSPPCGVTLCELGDGRSASGLTATSSP